MATPTDRPPAHALPLSALRAFEAAARRGSMTAGASELNVTHGAISRQITSLEQLVGCALFERGARGIRLTAAGERLFHAVANGFEQIRTALHGAGMPQSAVRVTTLPSFATRWLLPRLMTFRALHPEIEIRIHSSLDIADLRVGHHDMAIRYGKGSWPGLSAERLLRGTAYPVCSPAFLSGRAPITAPADLLLVPLIHNSATERWVDWFEENGVDLDVAPRGVIVDDYALALEYALGGHGVALGRDALVRDDVARGRLIRPIAGRLSSRFSYYLVQLSTRPLSAHASVFAEWLKEAAREEERSI